MALCQGHGFWECQICKPALARPAGGVAPDTPAPPSPILSSSPRASRNASEGAQGARRDFGSRSSRHDALARRLTFSDRELEVLGLLADGLSNAEIAEKLFLSRWTVKSHLERIKVRVPDEIIKSRAGLVGWALRSRLIP